MLHEKPLLEESMKAVAGPVDPVAEVQAASPERDLLAIRFEQFKRAARWPCGYKASIV
jgi:hypothetical protein